MKREPELIQDSCCYGIHFAHFDETKHAVPPGMQVFTYNVYNKGKLIETKRLICRTRLGFLELINSWNGATDWKYIAARV